MRIDDDCDDGDDQRQACGDGEQILALEAKLKDSVVELNTCKREKDTMEEKTRHVASEATAITEKVRAMERAMLEDRATLHAAHKDKDVLDARLLHAEKAEQASREDAAQANALLEKIRLDMQKKENSI